MPASATTKIQPDKPVYIYLVTGELLYTFANLQQLQQSEFAKRWPQFGPVVNKSSYIKKTTGEQSTYYSRCNYRISTTTQQHTIYQRFYVTQQKNFVVSLATGNSNFNPLAAKYEPRNILRYDKDFWSFNHARSVFESDYNRHGKISSYGKSFSYLAQGFLYFLTPVDCCWLDEFFRTENYLPLAYTFEHPIYDYQYYQANFYSHLKKTT